MSDPKSNLEIGSYAVAILLFIWGGVKGFFGIFATRKSVQAVSDELKEHKETDFHRFQHLDENYTQILAICLDVKKSVDEKLEKRREEGQ